MLNFHVVRVLKFGYIVGYIGLEQAYISPNLKSTNLALGIIATRIAKDLSCG
jgi:hypothetical protein